MKNRLKTASRFGRKDRKMATDLGLIKVGAAVPALEVGNTEFNTDEILRMIDEAEEKHTGILLFPELCITGYSCADLFFQHQLYNRQIESVFRIAEETKGKEIVVILGFYVQVNSNLYNCACVIQNGQIKGVVPKMFMPNSEEFYEARWFASGIDIIKNIDSINIRGLDVPFGRILFDDTFNGFTFGVEICEDLWLPISPGSQLALEGAHMIFNPSASNDTVAKPDYRRSMIHVESTRSSCGYIYTSAGACESTTDMVFSGHSIIAENGMILAENSDRFSMKSNITYSEIDIDRIKYQRRHNHNYTECARAYSNSSEFMHVRLEAVRAITNDEPILRTFTRLPFIPHDHSETNDRCQEIFNIQGTALARRLLHTHAKCAVVGISGGLDSTLALLTTVYAFNLLDKDPKDIIAVTMPGFGTTGKTYQNALTIMELLGTTIREISIKDSVLQHFKDIGHDENVHDVTYENSQARERTQILMDIANKGGGLVVGTGDLSEEALGWCTFNGDHMSMYNVNAGIPKTLLRFIIEWFVQHKLRGEDADRNFSFDNQKLADTLQAILDTPISPELLPPDETGQIAQKTEDNVGPYELHDFFIYYTIRWGMTPYKLYYAARHAFDGDYSDETIKKWLKIFYQRFFSQQFKRNCSPDGPKVGTVSLSARGDWKMPSDADATIWLDEIDKL